MAQQWEYYVAVLTYENSPEYGQQWHWNRGGKRRPLDMVMTAFGLDGWELVSLNVEEYRHFDSARDKRGYTLAEYPYQQTMATKQRALFKRPLAN